jgi:hypothetical protein
MDEARRQALIAERADVMRERNRLDAVLEYLDIRLGVQVEDAQPDPGLSTPAPVQLSNDVLSLIYDEEFHGWKMPKAAEEVLNRWSPEPHHRPLKTGELLAALRKGGLVIKESRILYRSLYTAPRFKLIKGGRWGLASWYPAERPKNGSGRQGTLGIDDSGEEDNVSHLPGSVEHSARKEVTAS